MRFPGVSWGVVLAGALLLGQAPEARAELSGTTSLRCVTTSGATTSSSRRELLGSSVDASSFEAFVDAAQAISNVVSFIGSALGGNVFGATASGFAGYEEVRQLLQATADKTASDFRQVQIRLGECDRIELTFHAWTSGDPLGFVRAGTPRHPAFSKNPATDLHQEDYETIRDASTTVTVSENELAAGSYLVAFDAKEADCGTCLRVIHVIELTFVPGAASRHPLDPPVQRIYDRAVRDRQERQVSVDRLSSRRRFLASQYRHDADRYQAQINNCLKNHPQDANCGSLAWENLPGLCPDVMLASQSQEACDEMVSLRDRIALLQTEIRSLDSQIAAILATARPPVD